MRLSRIPPAVAVLLFLSGCALETLSIEICTGTVAIAASTEPPETFRWDGGCGVGDLIVREAGLGGAIVWHIQDAGGGNRVTSPLAYGVAPPGARQLVGPVPLVPGTQYRTELQTLRFERGGPVTQLVGQVTFVR